MKIRTLAAIAAAASCLWLSSGVFGDELDSCRVSSTPPAARITACSQMIERAPTAAALKFWYLWRGNAKSRLRDLTGAIEDYTSALAIAPAFVDAQKNRGLAYQASGNYALALKSFDAAIQLTPTADLFVARSTVHFDLNDLEEAVADADAAMRLDSSYAKAYLDRGLAYHAMRSFKDARVDFNSYISLEPNSPIGYNDRAALSLDEGKVDEALVDYARAIARAPDFGPSYSHRGEAMRLKGDLSAAIRDHNRAIALDRSAEAYVNRALVWMDKGDLDLVIADCNAALDMDPLNYLAHLNRADAYRRKGDLQNALIDLNHAVTLRPHSPIALTIRGDVLRAQDHDDNAVADYNQALARVRDFTAAYVGRGLAFEATGDYQRARSDYRYALSLSPYVDARFTRPAQKRAAEHLELLNSVPTSDTFVLPTISKRAPTILSVNRESLERVAPSTETPIVPPVEPLSRAAFEVLKVHCARCHQTGMLEAGLRKPSKNFGNVLHMDEMIAQAKYVKAGDPIHSSLYWQVYRQEMPYDFYQDGNYKASVPNETEVAALRDWIGSLPVGQTTTTGGMPKMTSVTEPPQQ